MNKEAFLKQLNTGNAVELIYNDFVEAVKICKEVYGKDALTHPESAPDTVLVNIGGKHKFGKIRALK